MGLGSEQPDGRIDGRPGKHFRFPWQNEYQAPAPEDEPDSATDHYNIQCRWDNDMF